MPDWAAFLPEGLDDEAAETLRRHARTGRPLGAVRFVKRLEKRLGRPLAPRRAIETALTRVAALS